MKTRAPRSKRHSSRSNHESASQWSSHGRGKRFVTAPAVALLFAAGCTLDDPAEVPQAVAATQSALTTLIFANREWRVRTGSCTLNNKSAPGPNYWCGDAQDVWVDAQDQLHLKLNQKSALNNAYAAVEVETDVDGCGTFTFGVEGNNTLDALDKNVVLGLFTYSDDDTNLFHELDVEVADWGKTNPSYNLLYTTWKWDPMHPMDPDFMLPDNSRTSDRNNSTFGSGVIEHTFSWDPTSVTFSSVKNGSAFTSGSSRSAGSGDFIPACPTSQAESGMTARINLWPYQGVQPASSQEVIITDFTYVPYVDLIVPTNFQAASVADTVTLSWTEASMGEDGYEVERGPAGGPYALVAVTDPSAESYTDTDVSPLTAYEYRIRAVGGGTTSAYSSTVAVHTSDALHYYFGGGNGYIGTEVQGLPASPSTYHARTWVRSGNTYYPQGSNLAPPSSGRWAAQGLWGSNDGRQIFVTMHPAATDQYGTVAQAPNTITAANWPSTFNSDVVVRGPYATGTAYPAMNYNQPVAIRYAGALKFIRSGTTLDVNATNIGTATRWQIALDSNPSGTDPMHIDDVVVLRTTDPTPKYIVEGSGNVATTTTNAASATRFKLKGNNCNCSAGDPIPASSFQVRFESTANLKLLKYANSGASITMSTTSSSSANFILDAP